MQAHYLSFIFEENFIMYNGILHAHSGLRYIVLFLIIASVVVIWKQVFSKSALSAGQVKLIKFTFIFTHVQLLLGLVLWGMGARVQFSGDGMQNAMVRFFTLEHPIQMLIAIALITIGYIKAKKLPAVDKTSKLKWMWTVALLMILMAIPWPFLKDFGTWF